MARVLEGRRALVTAAADGLGRAYAVALAQAGAHVAACDVDPKIHELADALAPNGARTVLRVLDVADTPALAAFVADAAQAFGGLDLVVNNAGVVGTGDPVRQPLDEALAVYDRVMAVNLRAAFAVGRLTLPHLVERGGDLVNVTTDHVHTCGFPTDVGHDDAPDCPWAHERRAPTGGGPLDAYDASKAGVEALTQSWARAVAHKGVRVNSFGMGATNTPMYRGFQGDRGLSPLTMSPEAVARVLVELVAEGPSGRNADSVQLWIGHPTVLPPVSLVGTLGPAVTPRP